MSLRTVPGTDSYGCAGTVRSCRSLQRVLLAVLAAHGAYGNYFSGVFKAIGPSFNVPMYGATREVGWYVSGELGGYWFGTTNLVLNVFNPPVKLPNYATWNWAWPSPGACSPSTPLLRYQPVEGELQHPDRRSERRRGRAVSVANPGGLRSNWCSAAFVVSGKFDLTLASLSAAMQK